jgi:hypothetical protein
MLKRLAWCVGWFFCSTVTTELLHAQTFPLVPEEKIRRIEAIQTEERITIDGKLDEASWKSAMPSPAFVDLISGEATKYNTQVRVLWDKENLYVGYVIEEPNVKGRFTERDSPIYEDNDVELFIAGENAYYEFEINSLGTIYEGLFVWQSDYEKSGLSKLVSLDRADKKLRCQEFNGVGFTSHPRGKRWAFLGWDFPEAKTAVAVQGTLNKSDDVDQGWTVELAFPWKHMSVLNYSKPRSLPPKSGDVWRMDFSRFNQYKTDKPMKDSGGWALSHHGIWDSHIPECFPYVTFVESKKN